jgi:hypothetical protein
MGRVAYAFVLPQVLRGVLSIVLLRCFSRRRGAQGRSSIFMAPSCFF